MENLGHQAVGLFEAFWQEFLGAILNLVVTNLVNLIAGIFPVA
jgi:hypothetical protein